MGHGNTGHNIFKHITSITSGITFWQISSVFSHSLLHKVEIFRSFWKFTLNAYYFAHNFFPDTGQSETQVQPPRSLGLHLICTDSSGFTPM